MRRNNGEEETLIILRGPNDGFLSCRHLDFYDRRLDNVKAWCAMRFLEQGGESEFSLLQLGEDCLVSMSCKKTLGRNSCSSQVALIVQDTV